MTPSHAALTRPSCWPSVCRALTPIDIALCLVPISVFLSIVTVA
jgi:hypothetical protein